jgi:hypothetical protein
MTVTTATKQVTIYTAKDGKEFMDEDSCRQYELELSRKFHYFHVVHSPDLCEGRGYYGLTFVAVECDEYMAVSYVNDWCFKKFGSPVAYAQGVSPMPNWTVHRSTCNDYTATSRHIRVGDYKYPAEHVLLSNGGTMPGYPEPEKLR